MNTGFKGMRPLGYVQVAAGGADTALQINSLTFSAAGGMVNPPGIPAGTQQLLIIPEVQTIRWRDDGINPTTTVGMPLTANGTLFYDAANMTDLRVISATAGAVVNITAYGKQ